MIIGHTAAGYVSQGVLHPLVPHVSLRSLGKSLLATAWDRAIFSVVDFILGTDSCGAASFWVAILACSLARPSSLLFLAGGKPKNIDVVSVSPQSSHHLYVWQTNSWPDCCRGFLIVRAAALLLSRNAGNQNQTNPSQGSQNYGTPSHDSKPRTMSSFYAEWLREDNLDANTDVDALGDELFGRFTAAAHAYADEYASKSGNQLLDEMGILKR